jgi:hypothetical protein
MTEIKIKSIYGNLLFTYKAENATIRDAVEKAVKEKVSLRLADLSSANLRSADLSLADLRLADLSSAKNKETAYLPLFCKWNFSILGCEIQIGCEKRTIEQWDLFFASNEKLTTERGTEDFKQIEAVYNACKAYLLTLN